MLGKIISIEEVNDFEIQAMNRKDDSKSLGMSQMMERLMGYQSMDGYRVETDLETYHVLIDNGQSCCESWGYFSSEDDLNQFLNSTLLEIELTDTALNKQKLEDSDYYEEEGGIQFVDFKTSVGVFQLAVYNGHNGYYGHGIIVAKGSEVLLEDTL